MLLLLELMTMMLLMFVAATETMLTTIATELSFLQLQSIVSNKKTFYSVKKIT